MMKLEEKYDSRKTTKALKLMGISAKCTRQSFWIHFARMD